jgi:hypothetical protein
MAPSACPRNSLCCTRSTHSDLPFAEMQTIDELVEQQTNGERFTTVLLSSFALAGLVLAPVI